MNTPAARLILDVSIWREDGPNSFKGSVSVRLVDEKPLGKALLS
jgi:hypothetical protein